MTAPGNTGSAFAAAAAAATAQNTAPQSTAPAGSSGLVDPDENGGSSLFGGEKLPSLFNKFVMPGEARTGIIASPPRDKQSRDGSGNLKWWDDTAKKVVNHDTGRPLMDTVIVLQTDYRFTEQEVADRGLSPMDVEDDNGRRGLFASGEMKAAIKNAIREARVRSEKEMVGMRLTISRGRKVPIEGNKTKWVDFTAKLERP